MLIGPLPWAMGTFRTGTVSLTNAPRICKDTQHPVHAQAMFVE